MSVIKIKRGTTDPTAANVTNAGELAANTSTPKVFLKTADDSSTTPIWVGAQIEASPGDWNSTVKLPTQSAVNTTFMPKAGGTFTGVTSFGQGATAAGEIRLLEDTDDGANYTAFRGSARAANITYVLPTTDPTAGQVLASTAPTSNVATLSWADASSATTVTTSNDNTNANRFLVFVSGSGASSTLYVDETTGPLYYNPALGLLTLAGDLAVNGADITTTGTTATVFNANATTLSVGSAATAVSIGATTGTFAIRNPAVLIGSNAGGTDGTISVNDAKLILTTANYSGAGISGNTYPKISLDVAYGATGFVNIEGADLRLGRKILDGTTNVAVNLVFEGATNDEFETTLTATDPTADRTITLPNATGTVALVAGSDTQVLFNDGGSVLGGDAGLTYNKTTDSLTITGDLAVNGADITTTATGTATVFNTNATTVNMAGAGTTVSIGAATGTTTINNANTVVTGDLAVNGADITTSSTGTATLFNTNATTVNVAGAGTTVSIGAATGTTTINNANTVVTGDLAVNGGDISSTSSVFNIGATGNTTVGIGTSATNVSVGTSATTVNVGGATTNIGPTGTSACTVNIANGAMTSGTKAVNIGTSTGAGTTTITIGSTAGTSTTAMRGDTSMTGDLAVNGGDITTTSTTATVFNATATTLNVGQAATTISMGATTGTTTVRNDLNLPTGKVYQINGTSVLSGSALGSGVTSSSLTSVGTITSGTWTGTTIAVANGGTGTTSGSITGSGALTFTAGGTNTNVNLAPNGNGTVDVASKKITNLATPSASTDAANKQYVDDVAQGLHMHSTVAAATTARLGTLAGVAVSYSAGSITWTGGTALNTTFTDGQTLTVSTTEASASRLLVKNEGDASGLGSAYNGVWYAYGARELRRATDGDVAADWAGGDFVFVLAGTLYNNTGWVNTEKVTTLYTDPILFEQFSGAGTYTADESTLTRTGSQFSIKSTYTGQASITTLGTIGAGIWQGTVVGLTYGGTGKNLTASLSNGGIVWTDADSMEVLPAGTSGYILTSGGAGAPVWTNTITATLTGTASNASAVTMASSTDTTSYLAFVSDASATSQGLKYNSSLLYNATTNYLDANIDGGTY